MEHANHPNKAFMQQTHISVSPIIVRAKKKNVECQKHQIPIYTEINSTQEPLCSAVTNTCVVPAGTLDNVAPFTEYGSA